MSFENIIGQKRVISILERAIKSKRMPHALLFHGTEGVGKEAVALELAKALFCQQDEIYCNTCSNCKRVGQLSHPDLILIYPAPKQPKDEELKLIRESLVKNPYHRAQPWANPSILIDMIRNLKKTVSMTSYENKGRVVLIMDAHRMTIEAANSLLKILEEPLGKLTLILISSQANLLLPTIISRCQKIRFDPLPWQEIERALINREQTNPDQAKIFARMSFGSYRQSLELLDEDFEQKQNLMIDILRKVLMPDLDILLMVESLVNQQDKKTIKELVALMLVWFRDAMVMELLQNESDYNEKIINIDRHDTLKKFIIGLERIDYDQVIPKIEQALELIDRNVYLNLVLLQLLFELKKFLRRKIHV
jgi:DNA polymerase-3 subunit delta'